MSRLQDYSMMTDNTLAEEIISQTWELALEASLGGYCDPEPFFKMFLPLVTANTRLTRKALKTIWN
jgi:hypothetical protein